MSMRAFGQGCRCSAEARWSELTTRHNEVLSTKMLAHKVVAAPPGWGQVLVTYTRYCEIAVHHALMFGFKAQVWNADSPPRTSHGEPAPCLPLLPPASRRATSLRGQVEQKRRKHRAGVVESKRLASNSVPTPTRILQTHHFPASHTARIAFFTHCTLKIRTQDPRANRSEGTNSDSSLQSTNKAQSAPARTNVATAELF